MSISPAHYSPHPKPGLSVLLHTLEDCYLQDSQETYDRLSSVLMRELTAQPHSQGWQGGVPQNHRAHERSFPMPWAYGKMYKPHQGGTHTTPQRGGHTVFIV